MKSYDIEIPAEAVQEWSQSLYLEIKLKIITMIISKGLIPEYIRSEYTEYERDTSFEVFALNSCITLEESKEIFKNFAEENDSKLIEFIEPPKYNQLERLLEGGDFFEDSERKYKLEGLVSTLFSNSLVKI